MRAKRKKEKLAYFTDIQKRKNQEIINLRKRTKIINWVVIVISLIISSWLFYGAILKANTIYFYPMSALGNWQNVDKAVGEISLDFDADLKDFNENNSAIFEGGGIKQIFLGNFQNPSLTETTDKEIVSSKLKINFKIADKKWRNLQQENKEINLIEITPTLRIVPSEENISSFDSSTSSEEILPSESPSTDLIIPHQSENNLIIEETPLITNEVSPEIVPKEENEATPSPISLLKIFLKKVFAQESSEESVSGITTPTPTNDFLSIQELNSPTPDLTATPTEFRSENLETSPEIPFETTTENLNLEPTTEVINSETSNVNLETISPSINSEIFSETPADLSPNISPAKSSMPIFIIKYTLDGENWQILATIEDKNNYSTEFDLPITDWDEIANLQIAVESTLNTNLEENLIAFLDGAQLEIEYNLIEEDTELAAPTVSIEPFEFSSEIKTILDILKTKVQPEITLESLDQKSEMKNSCSVKPFNLETQAGEIKEAELFLERHQKGLNEKIIIGHLPMGIEIFFVKNNDYVIQPENNENQFILKIISLTNSQKGNFSIPIIYQVDNSFNVCQINVISF